MSEKLTLTLMYVLLKLPIFQRGNPNYGVRYTTCVGDGDSASHSAIGAERLYGPDVIIKKKSMLAMCKEGSAQG